MSSAEMSSGDVQLVIAEAHQAALTDLRLPFADFLRIAAVGDTHVAGETQLDGQVQVLRLVAGEADARDALLGDVVAAAADAVLRIVAPGGQRLNLAGVDGHHLAHADVAQGDADGAEQVLGRDAVGIPLGDGVGGRGQLVGLAVGELEGLVAPVHVQLAFRLHAVYGLVVQHAAIVAEEGAVLSADVDQHRGESRAARAALGPQRRGGASGVAVTAAAGIACIDRPQAAAVRVATGAHVVVEAVAAVEARVVLARHPRGRHVIRLGRTHEERGRTRRQFIAGRHFDVQHIVRILGVAGPQQGGRAEQRQEWFP